MKDNQLSRLKGILAMLYVKHGATDEVVKLSQFVDEIVVEKQKELGRDILVTKSIDKCSYL